MLFFFWDSLFGSSERYRQWRGGAWYRVEKNMHPSLHYYVRNPAYECIEAIEDDPWTTINRVGG